MTAAKRASVRAGLACSSPCARTALGTNTTAVSAASTSFRIDSLGYWVRVALRLARVDRRRINRDVDFRLGWVLFIDLDRAGDARETAAHRRDHQVLRRKLRVRVRRINLPDRNVVRAGLCAACGLLCRC